MSTNPNEAVMTDSKHDKYEQSMGYQEQRPMQQQLTNRERLRERLSRGCQICGIPSFNTAYHMNQHKDDPIHKRNKQMARDKAMLQRIKDAKISTMPNGHQISEYPASSSAIPQNPLFHGFNPQTGPSHINNTQFGYHGDVGFPRSTPPVHMNMNMNISMDINNPRIAAPLINNERMLSKHPLNHNVTDLHNTYAPHFARGAEEFRPNPPPPTPPSYPSRQPHSAQPAMKEFPSFPANQSAADVTPNSNYGCYMNPNVRAKLPSSNSSMSHNHMNTVVNEEKTHLNETQYTINGSNNNIIINHLNKEPTNKRKSKSAFSSSSPALHQSGGSSKQYEKWKIGNLVKYKGRDKYKIKEILYDAYPPRALLERVSDKKLLVSDFDKLALCSQTPPLHKKPETRLISVSSTKGSAKIINDHNNSRGISGLSSSVNDRSRNDENRNPNNSEILTKINRLYPYNSKALQISECKEAAISLGFPENRIDEEMQLFLDTIKVSGHSLNPTCFLNYLCEVAFNKPV